MFMFKIGTNPEKKNQLQVKQLYRVSFEWNLARAKQVRLKYMFSMFWDVAGIIHGIV